MDRGLRTEHKHYVEEDDQQDGNGVDGVAGATHPEGTFGDVFPARQEVRADGEAVGDGGEDDEGADEVCECGFTSERDGAEGGAEDCCEGRLVREGLSEEGWGGVFYQRVRWRGRDS